ncbi:Olfactory Receptor 1J1 [Manis pentadactyla]|nr:Olfactory Receptor 1J1 [Manis pentadactyla]
MRPENQSSVSEFLLLGLPVPPEQQGVFFALFLGMYLTTVLGNLLIILLVRLDSRLHTPMYFLLSHLALSDVSFASITVPKMLMNMQTQCQSITYSGCISQPSMGPENQSSVSEFLLLGLPIPPEQQGVLFALFLGMYLTTVLGNLLIILLVRLDLRLHTPMYSLLSILWFS